MTPERYKRVKDIFLAACDKPEGERGEYVRKACESDEEIFREVRSLLAEHVRETQVMPSEPEGPLGSMSSILSRANIDVGPPHPRRDLDEPAHMPADIPDVLAPETPSFMDDSSTSSQDSTTGIVDPGRFAAGTVAAGRYRIIELLGRGGMGEVYRADDLTLNQSVALKFLPALFGSDQKWLERFRNEVRIARQVTHPNVCRVFDISEHQGEQFISMEYIDGENLASLLRRIGRLPHDKALQIARQLCAGLSAAHERGVLHRDLKPANVMIDGRGSVRITDFGLAAPVAQIRKDAVRAGTPAYMSPEQLAGKAVTMRSDVYSLGLVLYEMYTGHRAFRAESLRGYQKLHATEDPTPISDLLDDIDPIVERMIMRCLEKDPKDRPSSCLVVAAGLPGGNPLREILAAGETPSPEVVAAVGEAHGSMAPRVAVFALATALACLIFFVTMAPKLFVVQHAIHDKPPAVLTDRAQTILQSLGYLDRPRDSGGMFAANPAYYVRVEANRQSPNRLALLARPRPGLVYFWYRQSPEVLAPLRQDGFLGEHDPAPLLPGMVSVRLDPRGRLIGLEAEALQPVNSVTVPIGPATADASSEPATREVFVPRMMTNWTPLLKAAEMMDMTRFTATTPLGAPPVFADERIAWEGSFEDAPAERVRVEAAAYRGQAVYFAIIGDWKEAQLSEDQATKRSLGESNVKLQTGVVSAMLLAGCMLAWKNFRSGRGDRPGATRMATAFFVLGLIAWIFQAHHVTDAVSEFLIFQRGMGLILYRVCLVWVFYMALEPYVRRIWPETVISWSRLLSGKWFDPLVGRDVLAGSAVGVISMLLNLAEYAVPHWFGTPVPLPSFFSVSLMLTATGSPASLFNGAIMALSASLLVLLFLVLVRMIAKRRWVAGISFVMLFAMATAHYNIEGQWWRLGPENLVSLAVQGLLAMVVVLLLMRHGLVAVIFCMLVRGLLMDFPVTWDLSVWYSSSSIAAVGSVLLTLGAGFYAALGGQGLSRLRAVEN